MRWYLFCLCLSTFALWHWSLCKYQIDPFV